MKNLQTLFFPKKTNDKFFYGDFWQTASQADVIAEVSKANVNARNKYGLTALMLAAEEGAPEHLKVLLDAGADVNAREASRRNSCGALWPRNMATIQKNPAHSPP